ncbi:carbohydrate esterase family 4 protein [Mycena alexandri]|uniref:chitin deacetylase n=1 Tax=Mycena alexandri TaxID=1745969 RepID=A0AAD6X631_9AGAR|nr:carbohydrate esterase family 4 protein [Mycena alexandri]
MRSHTSIAATALMLLGVRAAVSTESDEAALTDPTAQCTAYSYAPVAAALAQFPPIWTPVSAMVSTSDPGYVKFLSINASIPNIAPKGVLGVPDEKITDGYNPADPDCWWTVTQCVTPKVSGVKGDIAAAPEPRTLGYGFDDGPNCSHNAFYDYLVEKNQKATMFYIGSNVLDWPLQAQRAVADGHEICVHSWSHRSMTAFTNEQAFGELWYTMQAIKLVTGVTPTCWRPPLGDVDDRIRYIAQQMGLENVLWKYNSNDWEVGSNNVTTTTVQGNYDALIAAVGAGTFDTTGAIMLTHELNNYTMQTAVDNYPKLAAAFDHIVPVGVSLNKTQPYVETNYTQPSFAAYNAARVSGASPSGSSSGSAAAASGSGSKSTSGSTAGSNQGTSAGVALRVSSLTLGLVVLGAALAL